MTELSSAATAAAVGTTGFKAPGTTPPRTPRGYTPGLAAVNFGVYLALLTPVMVSMAFKIQHIDPTNTEGSLGLVMGVGAAFALIANPLVGRLSDRTTSRWGMRRPWILGGAIVGLGGFALIGAADSVLVVLLAWCLVQASMNAVLAAANATLPDQVPVSSRGKVSGIIGITTPIGILAGELPREVPPRRLRTVRRARRDRPRPRDRLRAAPQRPPSRPEARREVHDRHLLRLVRLQPAQAPRLRLDLADQVLRHVRLRGHRHLPAAVPRDQVRPRRAGGGRHHPRREPRVDGRDGDLLAAGRIPLRQDRQAPAVRRHRGSHHGRRPRDPRGRPRHHDGHRGAGDHRPRRRLPSCRSTSPSRPRCCPTPTTWRRTSAC